MAASNNTLMTRSRNQAFLAGACIVTALGALPVISRADVIETKKKLDLSSIESNVGDKLIAQHVPGAALVIVKDGKLVDLKCYGYRDFDQLLPVTPLTPFRIGSCSKGFTGMAIEMAVDSGVVSLSDNPSKYLPEFKLRAPATTDRVTLSDFLSQRSPLDDKNLDIDWNDTTPKKMLHVISGERPTRKPSSKRQPDMNYCVAGWTVAAASGTTFDKMITDDILRPLAMSDTRLSSEICLAEDAAGHILDKHAQPKRIQQEVDEIFLPASGIVSSPRDMAKWLNLLTSEGVFDGKRLVSERGFNELLRRNFDSNTDFSGKMGWDGETVNGYRVVRTSGGEPGYCACVMFLPERHVGVVLLTNLGPSSPEVEQALPAWILSQVIAATE